jgi:hypothetical protein
LGSGKSLSWPRDADRLPNGDTLVTDTLNHRVMEVTPNGEVIWEFYLRWGTYEAERMQLGDDPGGPTMRDQNLTGDYGVRGSVGLAPRTGEEQTVSQWLASLVTATPLEAELSSAAERWSHVTP